MAENNDWTAVCLEGGRLSAEEAAKIEVELETAPGDVRKRVQLLGYYFGKSEAEAVERRHSHIFWFIQHRPDLQLQAFGDIHSAVEPDAYSRAKQLWTQVIASRGNDTAVLRRASAFFVVEDRALAEELLRRGAALEPNAAYWRDRLAHLYWLAARRGETPEERTEAARRALAEYEAAIPLEKAPVRHYSLMIDAAQAAFLANDFPRAIEYANRVLVGAGEFAGKWVYGNGVHHGHIVLGRVALANDDLPAVRRHLIAAGETPGSPQLNSFGPDQEFAAELLARGEREAVLGYVTACQRFYRGGFGMLGALFRAPD